MEDKPVIDIREVEEDIEIAEDLAHFYHPYPPKQDGDITSNDIVNERGISIRAARDFMRRLIHYHPDKYEMLKVERDNSAGGIPWEWVIRRK